MKKNRFKASKIQLPNMQSFLCLLFFFVCVSFAHSTVLGDDTVIYASPGTTIINDEPSPEKERVYIIGDAVVYNSHEIKNAEIIKIKAFEKATGKVTRKKVKPTETKATHRPIKKIEPIFFNSLTGSGTIEDNQQSIPTVVPIQQQVKFAHLNQYHFQYSQYFFLNVLAGIVLLIVFNLLFQAFRVRPPPLF